MAGLLDIVALVPPLIAGMVVGYCLRGKKLFSIEKLVLGVILVLIFSLGFSIGSNTQLLEIMPTIGLNAIVLLFMTLLFSIVFVKAARKMVRI